MQNDNFGYMKMVLHKDQRIDEDEMTASLKSLITTTLGLYIGP